MYDEEFSTNATLSGKTVGSFTILLHPFAGEGFADTEQALDYSTTGARLTNSSYNQIILILNNDALTVEGLQAYKTGIGGLVWDIQNGHLNACIGKGLDLGWPVNSNGSNAIASNVLSINDDNTNGNKAFHKFNAAVYRGCTGVIPSSVTLSSGNGISGGGSDADVQNCLMIGFPTSFANVTGDYCGSDEDTGVGANDVDNIVSSDCFVDDDGDYKLKSGSDAIGTGNTDSSYPNDILGTVRGTTTDGDIGCHEFVAAGGVAPTSTIRGPLFGPMAGAI